jgi:aminopeptidase-like protein
VKGQDFRDALLTVAAQLCLSMQAFASGPKGDDPTSDGEWEIFEVYDANTGIVIGLIELNESQAYLLRYDKPLPRFESRQ